MYAVIEAGGKQHRVVEGETLKLEKIEAATGATVEFDRVLMIGGDELKIGFGAYGAPTPINPTAAECTGCTEACLQRDPRPCGKGRSCPSGGN